MCYNYEYLIKRGIKKSIREGNFKIKDLSDTEKNVLGDKISGIQNLLARSGDGNEESSAGNEAVNEIVSSFPGQKTIVIPITTKQREAYIFGFLPDWAKSFKDAKANYNCRCETILEKPTWKKAFTSAQRCLVPATAFYEKDKATKKRYRFTVKNESEIFYAGIFNHWTDKTTGEIHKTFAIITCAANSLVGAYWERMPVLLNSNGQQIWMNIESSVDECVSLFKSYPAELMDMSEAPPLLQRKRPDNNLRIEF